MIDEEAIRQFKKARKFQRKMHNKFKISICQFSKWRKGMILPFRGQFPKKRESVHQIRTDEQIKQDGVSPYIIILKQKQMEKNTELKTGKWKKTQHNRFMKALQKYGKNWPLIQRAVKTRSLTQVRSHAQKLFLSMTDKDIRQLNTDLDQRFNLFCKGKEQEGSGEQQKLQTDHKQDNPSSTINGQKYFDEGSLGQERNSQKDDEKNVSPSLPHHPNSGFVKVNSSNTPSRVAGPSDQGFSPYGLGDSNGYCLLPPWAMYYCMCNAMGQMNSYN